MKLPQNFFKYLIGLAVVIVLRLVPHPPNVEPIMASIMPFAKQWGRWSGLLFALLAIVTYDLLTNTLGTWSYVTAGTYGAIGMAAGAYFKNRPSSIKNYVGFSLVATLVYDAITGPGMSTFIFSMPFMDALVGQIPFTINHLLGNVVLSAVVSPALYRWVIANPKLDTRAILGKLMPALRG